MSLLSSIETISNTLYPDSTFIFGSQFYANVKAYEQNSDKFPLIILDNMMITDEEAQQNGNTLSDGEIKIIIFFLDTFNPTDKVSNDFVESAKTMARRIMWNIFQLEVVRLREGTRPKWRMQPQIRSWNGIYTGVVCTSKFIENINESICTEPDEEE